MQIIKTLSRAFSWIIVLFLLSLSVILFLSAFDTPVKFRVFSVLSGSMEPKIHTGSLVLVIPQENYAVGDVITVHSANNKKETVTHRLHNIKDDKYELKGDANQNPDSELVTKDRAMGKVVFTLPYLGRVVGFAQSQLGFILLIVIPAVILIYSEFLTIKKELLKIWQKKKSPSSDEEKTN